MISSKPLPLHGLIPTPTGHQDIRTKVGQQVSVMPLDRQGRGRCKWRTSAWTRCPAPSNADSTRSYGIFQQSRQMKIHAAPFIDGPLVGWIVLSIESKWLYVLMAKFVCVFTAIACFTKLRTWCLWNTLWKTPTILNIGLSKGKERILMHNVDCWTTKSTSD
jgi:hypothetical protein